MRGRELFGHFHRLIDDLAQSAGSDTGWQRVLRSHIDGFEAEARSPDSASARLLREELCGQLEHEAFRSTRPRQRTILLAAVKWLEAGAR